MPSSCRASGPRRRRWPASTAAVSRRRSAPGSPTGGPSWGSASASSSCSRASDEDGATTLGVLPGRTRRLEAAPTLPAHRLEPGRADARPPAVRRHRRRGRLLLRPLLRRRARGRGGGRGRAGADDPRAAVHLGRRTGSAARRPVPPRAERTGRPAPAAQLRRRWCGPPDAPPASHPLPRRGRRAGRQGHALRRPGRRGRPARAGRALRARGRRRARLPRHHARPRSGAARCSRSSSGPPAGPSSR